MTNHDDPENLFDGLLSRSTGPVNWRTLPATDAAEHWASLREWVDWFRHEFAYDHRVVPPCWYRHPALTSTLSALRDHWITAYDPMNSPTGASEWHRVLMQLETRLRDLATRTGCTTSDHRADLVADYPDDHDTWQRHLRQDIAAREEHHA